MQFCPSEIMIMRSTIVLFFFTFFSIVASAQHSLKVKVIDAATQEILPGANVVVHNTTTGGSTGSDGIAELKNLKNGQVELAISFIGYHDSLTVVKIGRAHV